ncbi:PEGA domain-containing protein [Polyangium sorediatum]|uniref:PEGA domain-containing protein n=1 Tax=Polyangium sorediatum TaxID=889274 RepID=A0ABT6P3W2_9BACT|nr:PEGA domain-containing protein [Polyangium sorediatum]MDI1435299.1 PEGA domain-containing protein [Polyangium sorediatum]
MTTEACSTIRTILAISMIFVFAGGGALGCGGAAEGGAGPETAGQTVPKVEEPEQAEEVVEDSGTLDILSDPPQDVLLDGKPIGKTPLTNHRVKMGPHDVTFLDPAEGDRTMSVNVSPGDHQTVKLDHPPKIREQK